MGGTQKPQKPADAAPVIPPVTAEDENVQLASDAERRRQARQRGRKATQLVDSTAGGSDLLG